MLEDKKVSGNNRKDGVKDKWSSEIILEVSTRIYSQMQTIKCWVNIYQSWQVSTQQAFQLWEITVK